MRLTKLNREKNKAKKELNNKQRKLSKDRVKAKKQSASTVEPSTADTTSNFEFSKGAFVKISADSTSGVHPRENSACVGNVVSTEYSVEQGINIVTVMVNDGGRSTSKVVSEDRVEIASKLLNDYIIFT